MSVEVLPPPAGESLGSLAVTCRCLGAFGKPDMAVKRAKRIRVPQIIICPSMGFFVAFEASALIRK